MPRGESGAIPRGESGGESGAMPREPSPEMDSRQSEE